MQHARGQFPCDRRHCHAVELLSLGVMKSHRAHIALTLSRECEHYLWHSALYCRRLLARKLIYDRRLLADCSAQRYAGTW